MSGSLICCTPFFALSTPVSADPAGYIIGGSGAAIYATVEKYDFTIETMAASTSLSQARTDVAATSSGVKAVIPSGNAGGGVISTITEYVDYSTDSIVSGTHIRNNSSHSGFGNATDGYFAGGRDFVLNTNFNTVDQYTYASDTATQAVGTLPEAGYAMGEASTPTFGVMVGNALVSNTLHAREYAYATNTSTSYQNISPNQQYHMPGVASDSTAYFFGGRAGGVNFNHVITWNLAAKTDSGVTFFSTGTYGTSAFENDTYALVAGGYTSGGAQTAVHKLEFAGNAKTLNVYSSSPARAYGVGTSNVHGGL